MGYPKMAKTEYHVQLPLGRLKTDEHALADLVILPNELPFKTAYGPKISVDLKCTDDSLAIQSAKQDCDINFILQSYQRTGVTTHLEKRKGNYGDFDAVDFQEAMNIVADARSMFETVPSQIREQFNNDPAQFLKFVTDEKNLPEMREMGLALPVEDLPAQGLDALQRTSAVEKSPAPKQGDLSTASGQTGTLAT